MPLSSSSLAADEAYALLFPSTHAPSASRALIGLAPATHAPSATPPQLESEGADAAYALLFGFAPATADRAVEAESERGGEPEGGSEREKERNGTFAHDVHAALFAPPLEEDAPPEARGLRSASLHGGSFVGIRELREAKGSAGVPGPRAAVAPARPGRPAPPARTRGAVPTPPPVEEDFLVREARLEFERERDAQKAREAALARRALLAAHERERAERAAARLREEAAARREEEARIAEKRQADEKRRAALKEERAARARALHAKREAEEEVMRRRATEAARRQADAAAAAAAAAAAERRRERALEQQLAHESEARSTAQAAAARAKREAEAEEAKAAALQTEVEAARRLEATQAELKARALREQEESRQRASAAAEARRVREEEARLRAMEERAEAEARAAEARAVAAQLELELAQAKARAAAERAEAANALARAEEARREEEVQVGLLRASEGGALAAVAAERTQMTAAATSGAGSGGGSGGAPAETPAERVRAAEARVVETRAAAVAAAAAAQRQRQLNVQRRQAEGRREAERRREADEEAKARALAHAEARRREAASRRVAEVARKRERAHEIHLTHAAHMEAEAERRLRSNELRQQKRSATAAEVVQALAAAARQRPVAAPSRPERPNSPPRSAAQFASPPRPRSSPARVRDGRPALAWAAENQTSGPPSVAAISTPISPSRPPPESSYSFGHAEGRTGPARVAEPASSPLRVHPRREHAFVVAQADEAPPASGSPDQPRSPALDASPTRTRPSSARIIAGEPLGSPLRNAKSLARRRPTAWIDGGAQPAKAGTPTVLETVAEAAPAPPSADGPPEGVAVEGALAANHEAKHSFEREYFEAEAAAEGGASEPTPATGRNAARPAESAAEGLQRRAKEHAEAYLAAKARLADEAKERAARRAAERLTREREEAVARKETERKRREEAAAAADAREREAKVQQRAVAARAAEEAEAAAARAAAGVVTGRFAVEVGAPSADERLEAELAAAQRAHNERRRKAEEARATEARRVEEARQQAEAARKAIEAARLAAEERAAAQQREERARQQREREKQALRRAERERVAREQQQRARAEAQAAAKEEAARAVRPKSAKENARRPDPAAVYSVRAAAPAPVPTPAPTPAPIDATDSPPQPPTRRRPSTAGTAPKLGARLAAAAADPQLSKTLDSASGLSDNYSLMSVLGKGSYGEVRLAMHRLTRRLVAVKTMLRAKLTDAKLRKRAEAEVAIHSRLRHRHVARLFEVITSTRDICLCMQYAPCGTLREVLDDHGPLPEDRARRYFRQLLGALSYCHNVQLVVHRDLKLDNLLLDSHDCILLADFGFAASIASTRTLKLLCGSPHYSAPEIFAQREYVGTQADLWSAGVLLYTCLAAHFPFQAETMDALGRKVLRGKWDRPLPAGEEAKQLISRMLTVKPAGRATLEEVCEHPWVLNGAAGPADVIPAEGRDEPEWDAEAAAELDGMGCSEALVRHQVANGMRTHVTAAYELIAHDAPQAP